MKENQAVMQTWFRRGMLAVLVVAAAVLWWTEGREQPLMESVPMATPVPTAKSTQRLKRETAYEQDTAALQALLEGGTADKATQELAAQKLTALITEHQQEWGLEEALQQAGYEHCVVIVQNGAVTVMIPEEKLNDEHTAQILTLCIAHTDAGAENIRIMALK